MRSWPTPFLPELPDTGTRPVVRLHDSASGGLVEVPLGPVTGLYVCGITPYDATHLGHAATYVTFDVLNRALRDAGHTVRYVQNVTDVDDPLLARAARDGVDWVLVMLVARENIAAGVTNIFDPQGRSLGAFTLTRPMDAVFIDDARVFHGVTAVEPADPTRPAHRDVLVATFRRS